MICLENLSENNGNGNGNGNGKGKVKSVTLTLRDKFVSTTQNFKHLICANCYTNSHPGSFNE